MRNPRLEELKQTLRRRSGVWIVGWVRAPGWVDDGELPRCRPRYSMWFDETSGQPFTDESEMINTSLDDLLDQFLDMATDYQRLPVVVRTNDSEIAVFRKDSLEDLGIKVEHDPKLWVFDELEKELAAEFRGARHRSLLDHPDIDDDLLHRYAAAAIAFHEAAIWKFLSEQDHMVLESKANVPRSM